MPERLNRLGFWNRLAIIAGTVFTFALPTREVYRDHSEARRLSDMGYQACMKNQHYVSIDGKTQDDYCWSFWNEVVKPSTPTWDDWWIMVFGCAVAALLAYGFLWIIVATAKWIWRGREAGKVPSPVRATPQGNETD